MSAELLRRAAWKLRGLVANLPVSQQANWEADEAEIYAGPERSWVAESLREDSDGGVLTAAYIVGMQPIVALKLVDCFERFAWMAGLDPDLLSRVGCDELVETARAILREPS